MTGSRAINQKEATSQTVAATLTNRLRMLTGLSEKLCGGFVAMLRFYHPTRAVASPGLKASVHREILLKKVGGV